VKESLEIKTNHVGVSMAEKDCQGKKAFQFSMDNNKYQ